MKNLLVKLFIFLSPMIAVTFFFEIYLRTVNTNYKEKLIGLNKNKDKVEMLILGNSHANYGIDPTQFNLNTYNMAMVNQPLLHDYMILDKIIDSVPNLKKVIISLDYHTLYFSDQGIRNNWIYYDYGIDTNIEFKAKLSRFWIGYTPKVAFSMFKYDFKRRIFNLNSKKPTLSFKAENGVLFTDTIHNGWLGYSGTMYNKLQNAEVRNRANGFNSTVTKKSERVKGLKIFKSMLKLLDSKNIKVYIITLPCHPKFRKMIHEKVRQRDILEIKEIIKNYDAHYIDFFNIINQDKLFYDSDHLNKLGAKFFSKKLNNCIH
jgi:hypothetical protein